ncbi:helix-turn-helix domain-containing protein [Marinospirillum sp. MEB164]|uniref:Helix-turn-helix domain-containing protein n=1 Tax=Marinospirillum alkalitolerans TaxID=3123374 RepID=A0ABW8PXX1_9GAMM
MMKHANITQIKKALALRSIGMTRAAIAEKTGLSPATLSRIFKRFNAPKGAAVERLAREAQSELLDKLNNNQALRLEIAKLLHEDMALTRLIREKIADSLEALDTTSPEAAAVNLRALNSAASAMITAQKTARIALGAESITDEEVMPVLRIETLTDTDIAQLRRNQQEAYAALNGDSELANEDKQENAELKQAS